ncbi:related to NmrA-like family protein [Cephalotrichum gorgonifer]|uniref:Related to NmrA-like family protein n=1 Tax=Cephalotrichum gorgonifer TaxID=2041049 RepID=A0AAE8T0K1_9PEZI|nr:related to NmrA-like family protein [Cephalotrichum gorgonifer]
MSILVVGAGELGLATLSALSAHPSRGTSKLAVLLRQETATSSAPEKQEQIRKIRSFGVDIETGDFINDPAALVPIFKKYSVVIQCAGYGMAPGTQLGVTKAVLEAGVPRYFPWQFGVDYEAIGAGSSQPLFDEMLSVRALLRAQEKTAWTVVSTGLFMSYLFIPDFGVVDLENRTVRALGGWDNTVTVTNPEDIGVMVADIVFNPRDTENRVVYIGSDTISYGQLADLLDGAFGLGLKREEWKLEFLRGKLESDPENLWLKYQNIFAKGVGVSWPKEKTLNHQRGISLIDVASYVEKNKASFASKLGI